MLEAKGLQHLLINQLQTVNYFPQSISSVYKRYWHRVVTYLWALSKHDKASVGRGTFSNPFTLISFCLSLFPRFRGLGSICLFQPTHSSSEQIVLERPHLLFLPGFPAWAYWWQSDVQGFLLVTLQPAEAAGNLSEKRLARLTFKHQALWSRHSLDSPWLAEVDPWLPVEGQAHSPDKTGLSRWGGGYYRWVLLPNHEDTSLRCSSK